MDDRSIAIEREIIEQNRLDGLGLPLNQTSLSLWREAMHIFERAEDRILNAINEVKEQMRDDRSYAASQRQKLWEAVHDHEQRLEAIEQDDFIDATRKRDVALVVKSLLGGSRGIVTTIAAIVALLLGIITILNQGA